MNDNDDDVEQNFAQAANFIEHNYVMFKHSNKQP